MKKPKTANKKARHHLVIAIGVMRHPPYDAAVGRKIGKPKYPRSTVKDYLAR